MPRSARERLPRCDAQLSLLLRPPLHPQLFQMRRWCSRLRGETFEPALVPLSQTGAQKGAADAGEEAELASHEFIAYDSSLERTPETQWLIERGLPLVVRANWVSASPSGSPSTPRWRSTPSVATRCPSRPAESPGTRSAPSASAPRLATASTSTGHFSSRRMSP